MSVEDLHIAVFGAGSLGPLLLTSPGGVAHKAMAAVPGVRTAWEERAPRHLQQSARLGGKLGLSVGGTPAPDLTAPPVANAPDFPGRRGSVPGLPSPGTVSMDVAV